MKWLILLALVACGKHIEPKGVDLRDSDGDQIQNYKETEFDKYVANFETLKDVNGVLSFYTDKQVDLKFSNKHDLLNKSMELITSNEALSKNDEYFSEWSKIDFAEHEKLALAKPQYKVNFSFAGGSDKPDEILFVSGKTILSLGLWQPNLSMNMAAEDLMALSQGDASIVMVKKFKKAKIFPQDSEQSIKEKTYRVYFGNEVFYVSKEMSFDRFLELKQVQRHLPVNEDFFFFSSRELDIQQWFSRELQNGDKVVVKGKLSELRNKFFERFTYQKTTISRQGGVTGNVLDLKIKKGAKVYIRMKSLTKTMNVFEETVSSRREEHGSPLMCNSQRRSIIGETVVPVSFDGILNDLNYPEILQQTQIVQQADEKNVFLELKVDEPLENLKLMFRPLPASTYTVITGEYRNNCFPGEVRGRNTNPEGKLSLEIESYVEKL